MTYLFLNLVICLFLATLIGFLAGWLVSPNLNQILRSKRKTEGKNLYKPGMDVSKSSQKHIGFDDHVLNVKGARQAASADKKVIHKQRKQVMTGKPKNSNNNKIESKLKKILLKERNQFKRILAQREKKLTAMQDQFHELKSTYSQSEQEAMQTSAMYEELQDQYRALRREHNQMTDQYMQLQQDLDAIKQEKKNGATQIPDTGLQNVALGAGMKNIAEQYRALNVKFKQVRQEADECQQQYQETLNELQNQQVHCRSITEHFAGMDKQLAASRAECAQLKIKLEEVHSETSY